MSCRKNAGFSLLELWIALVIGLICSVGILQIYSAYQNTARLNRTLVEMQENIRVVTFILRQAIETAGYIGCSKLVASFPISSVNRNTIISAKDNLMVYQGTGSGWLPVLPAILNQAADTNSDIIMVQAANNNIHTLQHSLEIGEHHLTVDGANSFKANDKVIIADCLHVYVAIVQTTRKNVITLTQSINTSFPIMSQIGKMDTDIFYIAATKYSDLRAKTVNALFLQENGRREEIASDIVSLHVECVLYNNNTMQIVPPSQVIDWQKVVALQINLLFRSSERISKNFSYLGKYAYSQDGYFYKPVEIFVSLKERM